MDEIRVMLVGRPCAGLEAMSAAFAAQDGLAAVGDVVDVARLGFAVRNHQVDVVVIEGDTLGNGSGYQPIHEVLAANPDARIVLMGGEPRTVAWALCEGASGFIPAEAKLAEVIAAVQQTARSGVSLSPTAQLRLLERYRQVGPGFADSTDGNAGALLTARECEVLRLVARGGTNGRVAAEFRISTSTVKNHLSSIYRKLGVSSRSQAVAEAFRRGFLDCRW